MLTTLTVMFAFALPYPRKFNWLRRTAFGRFLNNYNWCFLLSRFAHHSGLRIRDDSIALPALDHLEKG